MTTAPTTLAAAPAVIAHPYPAGGWAWWPILPLLWFLLVIVVIVSIARWGWWGRRRWYAEPPGHGTRSGEQRLAERFAVGEIDEQEYRARLSVLREGEVRGERR